MDGDKLRHLERQYRIRVKTGCGTCRIRKVKCDETHPACLRCTKTGRTCDGYAHIPKAKQSNHAAAASYRNSAFLVVPQRMEQFSMSRSPSRSLSPDPKENRSFEYFQMRTLPMWTEFFDSDLWSRTVLQMSHDQPAIKHGILALSIMHERYENVAPISKTASHDFAFFQYMQAVKHSNELLTAYQQGKASLEMVLIACIIFTCYENLAGNHKISSMHLRNGLRILDQHKHHVGTGADVSRGDVANSLYRFDLEAMTFSDNASPYDYILDLAPICPQVRDKYTRNDAARDDLVGILRCMMWLSGVADGNPKAPEHSEWLRVHREMSCAIKEWEVAFAEFQRHMSFKDQADPKLYAGNTLLKMAAITTRIISGSGAGVETEMAWDAFIESFKTIVDLAETIPILRPPSRRTTSPSAPSLPGTRLLAPNPATPSPTSSSTSSNHVFTIQPSTPRIAQQTPSHFTPSFELSPIVPLFIVACRCRDPIIRRRAIALLLSYRRREGVWDSLGAGMVAAQCMRMEEGLSRSQSLDFDNIDEYLKRSPSVRSCLDVPEEKRVKDISVEVKVNEGKVDLVYSMTTGEECEAQQVYYESRGDGMEGAGGETQTGVKHLNNFLKRWG